MISSTTEMTYRLSNLREQEQRITYQTSTGKILDNGSDDASIFTREVYVNDKIRVYEGIKSQVDKTNAQNNTSDSVMSEIKKLLDYTKVEVLKGLNGGTDTASKEAIAVNLEGVKNNLFMLANEQVEGEYLFAGSNSIVKPFEKDSTTGVVTYHGDGLLRTVAVEDAEYRERGITGFDMMMYSTDEVHSGSQMSFNATEKIIDESGAEWKFVDHDNVDGDNDITTGVDMNRIYKFDAEGQRTNEYLEITAGTGTDYTTVSSIENYKTDLDGDGNSANDASFTSTGKVFTPKHLIFEDIDKMINALRNKDENGNPVTSDVARDLLGAQDENLTKAFDAVNIGHAKLGGRNKVFEMAGERLTSKITHFNILRSEVSSADLTKLAIESKALELTYTAMYSTINRMNQLSLVNFIR